MDLAGFGDVQCNVTVNIVQIPLVAMMVSWIISTMHNSQRGHVVVGATCHTARAAKSVTTQVVVVVLDLQLGCH